MESTPTTASESAAPSPYAWRWSLFPTFWTALFGIALVLNTLGLVANHPERLGGWRGAGLVVLLFGMVGAYQWLSWGRIYRDGTMSVRRALISVAVQLLVLCLLVVWYDSSFAWFSLALPYQIIGGLPQPLWPLPLVGVLLVLVGGTLPINGSGAPVAAVVNSVLLFVINGGIALFIRLLNDQRDQLSAALGQLGQAHATLAANAAQQEELAVLRERSRLARAMHDDIGHALVVLNVKLEAAQLLYARDPARGDAELEATRDLIRATMADLRRALADLRTPTAAHESLLVAIPQLANAMQARTSCQVVCEIAPATAALAGQPREVIWYVAREALANVERHAAAAHTTVTLARQHDGWLLRIADDGVGVRPNDLRQPEHYGVLGMRERLNSVGGTLVVQRGNGGGTVVEARLPVVEAPEGLAS